MSKTTTFKQVKDKAEKGYQDWLNSEPIRIIVGAGTCGRAAGADAVIATLMEELERRQIKADITRVGCIGLCYLEPLVDVVKQGKPRVSYGNVTPNSVSKIIDGYIVGDDPQSDMLLGTIGDQTLDGVARLFDSPVLKPQVRIATRNCGFVDPEDINQYIARGGYTGLDNALKMTPEQVIEEVSKSGLRGRGGGGAPTGWKWNMCRQAAGDKKYIICNADEGDPGAFMDRSVLESDPHTVLEGMLIGAYAMGATDGYIYCRAEYPQAITRLQQAIAQMEEYGLVGDNILDSGFNFHLKIKEGAGAFVCGEETALMMSIEGNRGMPRPRPPFPAQSGLWGYPSNINNVETWANVSAIMEKGGDWYGSYGTEKSKGTKTFALAGKVNCTGLIEVPMGTSLHEIVFDIGGGILDGKKFKAVQTGGPSGGFIPADQDYLTADYESLAAAGSIMGSGAMVVMDEETCAVDMARYFLTFTQSESCGKCVPCRVGTREMLGILTRVCAGNGVPEDIDRLSQLCETVKKGSLCGLGGTAPNPVLTSMKNFRNEYDAHINEGKCPSLACASLISFYVDPAKCKACMICARNCPNDAIKGGKKMIHVIDQDKCIKCGVCLEKCPAKFSAIVKLSGETLDVPDEPVAIGEA
ncbi:MAG: NADH-quinone oxidoreductase subunit NuoF [Chloroflexi bacterium]|jgi:NADH-quinone oxidoreductase subunit F|nr:NADH-quinone oxidoreductase subunit NuoF [Chloroflexota bacterium]MBT7081659.1 NADH-quinone oxidoreductase subunit NuoF [Chloroflexota bacterium]MBT7289304.1 NADH-quinone oxidoreductase subunit NuoF [Chloroflexota bacterium]